MVKPAGDRKRGASGGRRGDKSGGDGAAQEGSQEQAQERDEAIPPTSDSEEEITALSAEEINKNKAEEANKKKADLERKLAELQEERETREILLEKEKKKIRDEKIALDQQWKEKVNEKTNERNVLLTEENKIRKELGLGEMDFFEVAQQVELIQQEENPGELANPEEPDESDNDPLLDPNRKVFKVHNADRLRQASLHHAKSLVNQGAVRIRQELVERINDVQADIQGDISSLELSTGRKIELFMGVRQESDKNRGSTNPNPTAGDEALAIQLDKQYRQEAQTAPVRGTVQQGVYIPATAGANQIIPPPQLGEAAYSKEFLDERERLGYSRIPPPQGEPDLLVSQLGQNTQAGNLPITNSGNSGGSVFSGISRNVQFNPPLSSTIIGQGVGTGVTASAPPVQLTVPSQSQSGVNPNYTQTQTQASNMPLAQPASQVPNWNISTGQPGGGPPGGDPPGGGPPGGGPPGGPSGGFPSGNYWDRNTGRWVSQNPLPPPLHTNPLNTSVGSTAWRHASAAPPTQVDSYALKTNTQLKAPKKPFYTNGNDAFQFLEELARYIKDLNTSPFETLSRVLPQCLETIVLRWYELHWFDGYGRIHTYSQFEDQFLAAWGDPIKLQEIKKQAIEVYQAELEDPVQFLLKKNTQLSRYHTHMSESDRVKEIIDKLNPKYFRELRGATFPCVLSLEAELTRARNNLAHSEQYVSPVDYSSDYTRPQTVASNKFSNKTYVEQVRTVQKEIVDKPGSASQTKQWQANPNSKAVARDIWRNRPSRAPDNIRNAPLVPTSGRSDAIPANRRAERTPGYKPFYERARNQNVVQGPTRGQYNLRGGINFNAPVTKTSTATSSGKPATAIASISKPKTTVSQPTRFTPTPAGACFFCKKQGHRMAECPDRKKLGPTRQAMLIEAFTPPEMLILGEDASWDELEEYQLSLEQAILNLNEDTDDEEEYSDSLDEPATVCNIDGTDPFEDDTEGVNVGFNDTKN